MDTRGKDNVEVMLYIRTGGARQRRSEAISKPEVAKRRRGETTLQNPSGQDDIEVRPYQDPRGQSDVEVRPHQNPIGHDDVEVRPYQDPRGQDDV